MAEAVSGMPACSDNFLFPCTLHSIQGLHDSRRRSHWHGAWRRVYIRVKAHEEVHVEGA